MNGFTKKFCIIFFIIITASASIIIPFIYVYFSVVPKKSSIIFIPTYIKSFPNHTAWLIVEINIKESEFLNNFSITVESNESVSLDYKIWNNQPFKKVLELFIKPNSTHLNHTIELEAVVSNQNAMIKNSTIVDVIDWDGKNISAVIEMRDAFISFLSLNQPSFGINESVLWNGFDNAPQILIVEHYLFRSESWEMGLSRHVTIAPHDWIEVYLRPRNQTIPFWAGKIASWSSGNHTVVEIEPPPKIYR